MNVKDIKIKDIVIKENSRSSRDNELAELMRSVKQHGLKQPIGVSPDGKKYVLEYGWRRYEAFRKLGYNTIPAVMGKVKELKDLLIVNVIENIQRKDISPFELGRVCAKLKDQSMTNGEIGARLSIATSRVKAAIDAYNHTPAELRHKVVFMKPGSGEFKKGFISSSLAQSVIGVGRTLRLNNTEISKIMEYARVHELVREDILALGRMLQEGVTMGDALKEISNYQVVRVNHIVNINEMEKMCKKHKTGKNRLIQEMVYGKIKGRFKKPSFADRKFSKKYKRKEKI